MRVTGAVYPRLILSAIGIGWAVPLTAVAGSNLVAIDDLARMPDARAIGRDSFAGDEIHFGFDEGPLDFGRVVVRTREPFSVVRRDLFVGYAGGALVVDARDDTGRVTFDVDSVEIWFRLRGRLRSAGLYEWDVVVAGADGSPEPNLPASMPLFWADGEPCGAEVTIAAPPRPTDGRVQRMLAPRGEVRLHAFERQTGGAWVVLRPSGFRGRIEVTRCVLRELPMSGTGSASGEMPLPVAYVPIRRAIDRQVNEAVARGAEALLAARKVDGTWPGTDVEDSIRNTAVAAAAVGDALGRQAVPASALDWLGAQVLDQPARWRTQTVAARLSCLARFGELKAYRRVIHSDIAALADAQTDEGGWTAHRRAASSATVDPWRGDHAITAHVLDALRDARLAGAIVDSRLWRRAMQYWTDAQLYEGGYGQRMERFGGIGDAPSGVGTARGAASLMTSLDMAAGVGGRHCTTFQASPIQIQAIQSALGWLDTNFGEPLPRIGVVVPEEGVYERGWALQCFRKIFGIEDANGREMFERSARELLDQYERQQQLFGLRGADGWGEEPSVWRTAQAVSMLAAARAPTLLQRVVVGDDEGGPGSLRGDVAHVAHFLMGRRGIDLNWRRASLDQPIRELLEVPILLVTVVGTADWSPRHWRTLRSYCLSGGTVVIDIDEGAAAQRAIVRSGLRETFPEYHLRARAAGASEPTGEVRTMEPPSMSVMANGFRDFLFLAEGGWSCEWQLYEKEAESLKFVDRLLDYVTDGDPAGRANTDLDWSYGAVASHTLAVAHAEVGGTRPVYPDLVTALDRILRDHYRLATDGDRPNRATDLMWVSVVGDRPPSEATANRIRRAVEDGAFLFVDIVGGEPGRDGITRAWLAQLAGVTFAPLRGSDPVLTGDIAGTRGFDVVDVALRPALHTPFSKTGPCHLFTMDVGLRQVGVYSVHDVSSGIGGHIFPGCRGIMPRPARELAMNVALIAYQRKLERQGAGAEPGGGRH